MFVLERPKYIVIMSIIDLKRTKKYKVKTRTVQEVYCFIILFTLRLIS